jgi:hypothetical protein
MATEGTISTELLKKSLCRLCNLFVLLVGSHFYLVGSNVLQKHYVHYCELCGQKISAHKAPGFLKNSLCPPVVLC